METFDSIYVDNTEHLTKERHNLSTEGSWFSLVEEELGDSFGEKILQKDTPPTTLEMSDLNKLKEQIDTVSRLKSCISTINRVDNFDDFLENANKVVNIAESFSNNLGLKLFKHPNNKQICRSSYKFCNNNYGCNYNYNTKKYSGCYAQHYVHNLVYADMDCLIRYITNSSKDNHDKNFIRDIKKTLDTILFVLTHMYDELKNASYYNPNVNMHIDRTPKKNKTKTQH